MNEATRTPKIVWIKRQWKLKENPFPSEAIARLGGTDNRENGLLFDPKVVPDKVAEATEKFVLGGVYSGLKFGYLWSLGTGLHGDARGFGKSSLLQYLVEEVNADFGERIFLNCGLEKSDAKEHPICAVLASFDMANARSLSAVFFEAARYACRFKRTPETPTLAERIRKRLVDVVGSDELPNLISAVDNVQENLRGRTLGPPVEEFLALLCGDDTNRLRTHIDGVTPTKRTRSGASYLATFLLVVKAAGINHVLLCCDQLEDFAATTTTRQKRALETERFRDYILEIQPMSDMLSCVVTMHPRATQAIGDLWRQADLPNYDYDREENRHRVVILERVANEDRARNLLIRYLEPARTAVVQGDNPLYPFTVDAVGALYTRSDGKPREILRKANALIEAGAEENWDVIDGDRAVRLLDSLMEDNGDGSLTSTRVAPPTRAGLWSE